MKEQKKNATAHAEILAIEKACKKIQNWRLEDCEMYVTLEPCCHYGKTPPCTEAIIENGISKVVIGSRDPNPLVAGKGVKILREHGIEVVCDFLKEECDKLNPVFFHYSNSLQISISSAVMPLYMRYSIISSSAIPASAI